MATVTLTQPTNKSEIELPQPSGCVIIPGLAYDPTVAYVGKLVVLDPTTRRWTLAAGSAAGTSTTNPVGLCSSQRGRALSILKQGFVGNKELTPTGIALGAKLYVADAAGVIADAAGTNSKVVGVVLPSSDGYGPDSTALVFIDIDWN